MAVFNNDEVNSILLDFLTEEPDFQDLIRQIAERFGIEIAVVSIDGRPLFHTGDFILSDSRRYSRMTDEDNVYLSALEDGEFRVAATIFSDEFPYGAVLINCHDKTKLSTASAIAEALAKVYQYYFGLREKPQIYSFVNQILAHFLLSESFMPNAAYTVLDELTDWSSSKVHFRPGYVVAAFRSRTASQTSYPSGAVAEISKYIPNSYCIKKNDMILSFLYALDPGKIKENKLLRSSLDSFCRNFSLTCAISDPFTELESRSSAVKQATLLVNNSGYFETKNNLLFAEDYNRDLLLLGALEVSEPKIFRQSDIDLLVVYDIKNSTEYLATLESYLLSAGHFTKASKMLFVDRGTLKYRMNKIREILPCDPDDPKTAERLLLAINMRKIILYKNDK